ncbi:MAG TPA: 2-dehydropantoate 2-reductase, partial [Anaerolineae bacterium]|nr:2-dehydropantoate 2-reductase [Anaerolineae bacterium]
TPSDIGVVDYVIVAVKQYQLSGAVSSIPPLIGQKTTVVPLLNGIDAHEQLMDVADSQHIIGGLSSLVSMIEAPGVIRHESQLQKIVLGELDCNKTKRVETLVQAWASCGVEAIHADDIFVALWTKFLFIASFGGVTSLCRGTAGEVLDTSATRELLRQAMEEVEVLALEQEIILKPDIVQSTMTFIEGLEPTATSSMQRDVASGKPFELEAFSGTIVRLGREFQVPTPVHGAIYALLLPALKRALTSS